MNEQGMLLRAAKLADWEDIREGTSANSIKARRFRRKVKRDAYESVVESPKKCDDDTFSLKLDIGDDDEVFSCRNVDFLSFLSLDDLAIYQSKMLADIWGWRDEDTLTEITILCLDNGVTFINNTNPVSPVVLGRISGIRPQDPWCDVKVYGNVVYIVQDNELTWSEYRSIGINVFNLSRLIYDSPDISSKDLIFSSDFIYTHHGNSHNLAINTESGYLYSMGSNTCKGGLHIIDVKTDPLHPQFVTCIASEGYTHDAQCVNYSGPDKQFTDEEICFAFNEDSLIIWNVTDKLNPIQISKTSYNGYKYVHQGWLGPDMSYMLLGDELDEYYISKDSGSDSSDSDDDGDNELLLRTRTYFVTLNELSNPRFEYRIIHREDSIDHNLYFWGTIHARGWGGNPALDPNSTRIPVERYAYLTNYAAGLKVLDLGDDPAHSPQREVKLLGEFDVSPDVDGISFLGSWSSYMHPSGVIAISSIGRGLFFLQPRMVFDAGFNENVILLQTESVAAYIAAAVLAENEVIVSSVMGVAGVVLLLLILLWFVAYQRRAVTFTKLERLPMNRSSGEHGSLSNIVISPMNSPIKNIADADYTNSTGGSNTSSDVENNQGLCMHVSEKGTDSLEQDIESIPDQKLKMIATAPEEIAELKVPDISSESELPDANDAELPVLDDLVVDATLA